MFVGNLANGNRIAITYPSGRSARSTLDAWGGLFISSAPYLPFGPETAIT